MEAFIESLDAQLSTLVGRISRYENIEDASREFAELDRELVAAISDLREHYRACQRLEELRNEGQTLDKNINDILVELAQCRKELEHSVIEDGGALVDEEDHTGDNSGNRTVDADQLLDYATKITRFTQKLPGSEQVLPWPTEDQLRRGMLATLAVLESSGKDHIETEERHAEASSETGHEREDSRDPQKDDDVDMTDVSATASAPAAAPAPARKPLKPAKISLDMDSDEE